ncbi:MAG TPA: type II toxin-antitoxin system Phd/YefM family antitoxin [Thermoanaerobaculia bacterium]|nr:type II toxin-antitoxin system Phd/YefM family antitoxin [Thermoanaerobaculia bacterium]
MSKRYSIAEARMKLPSLVREAESGKAVELTRRGESVAVLLGREQYERLSSRTRRFSEAWDDFSREVELAALEIDPDEVFGSTRDDSPGRDSGL